MMNSKGSKMVSLMHNSCHIERVIDVSMQPFCVTITRCNSLGPHVDNDKYFTC